MRNNFFDVFLFKLFVFTLSLHSFIELPFGDFYSQVIPQFSTTVMLVGLAFQGPKLISFVDNNVLPFVRFWLFSVFYTFLACSFLVMFYYSGFADQIDLQAWNLEIPYRAVMRDLVFWTNSVLALLYSYYNLRYVVPFKDLTNVIEFSIIVILFVGLLQFGFLQGNGLCATIYVAMSSVFKLVNLSNLQVVDRGVCFWGAEPASASSLCMFIFPYSIITFFKSNRWRKFRFFIYSVLFVFFLLNSGSSSTMITTLIVLICTLVYLLKGTIERWLYWVTFLFGFLVVILYTIDIEVKSEANSAKSDSFEYIILGKFIDKENGSTATRVSTVCNDMKIFASYPFTGVGNGCQGYFYKNNIPEWTKSAREVQMSINYETGSIGNGGGNFFASYISGYGLIGIIVLFFLIRKYQMIFVHSIVNHNPVIKFVFSVCIIVFLLAGWYVQTIEDNKLMFMLALGCIPNND